MSALYTTNITLYVGTGWLAGSGSDSGCVLKSATGERRQCIRSALLSRIVSAAGKVVGI